MANYTEVEGDKITSAIQNNITTVLQAVDNPKNSKFDDDFIYQADPRTKSADFSDYPIIYLENYSATDDSQNIGGNLFEMSVTAEIHIVAEDDSLDSKQWHDRISDSLAYMFRYGQRTELAENGISQPEITRNQRITGIDVADQPVIRREMEVSMSMQIDMEQINGANPPYE